MERANQGGSRSGRLPGGTSGGGVDIKMKKVKISLAAMETLGVNLEVLLPPCQVNLVRCDPLVAEQQRRRRRQSDDNTSAVQGRHHCDKCPKHYATKGDLGLHKKLHKDPNCFRCPICRKRFLSHSGLLSHRRTHTGLRPYRCTKCSATFTRSACLRTHLFYHSGERRVGNLASVIRQCQVPLVRCDSQVPAHQRQLLLRAQSSGSNPNAASGGRGGGGARRRRYYCDQCPKSYATKSQLTLHKKIHVDRDCFRCSICGKRHATPDAMYYHRKVHLGLKPFKCQQCSKAFWNRSELFRHITRHTGEKPYGCSGCGKRFREWVGLKHHTRRLAPCKDGGEAYRRKGYKEPRFPCSTCGRSFALKEDLANHVGYHRDLSVERALAKKRRQ